MNAGENPPFDPLAKTAKEDAKTFDDAIFRFMSLETERDGRLRGYSTICGFFKLVIMRRLMGMPENERVFPRGSLSTVSPANDDLFPEIHYLAHHRR
jgi:hypothetical protein